jgi:hypothetical protein
MKPLTIFGDQGILNCNQLPTTRRYRERTGDSYPGVQAVLRDFTSQSVYERDVRSLLGKYEFIIDKPEKTRTHNISVNASLVWRGSIMSNNGVSVIKKLWSDVQGALEGEYHWERKAAFRSIQNRPEYNYIWKRIAFGYEKLFGFEFEAGESMNHPDNLGVCKTAPRRSGILKDHKVKHLMTPSVAYNEEVFIDLPYAEPPRAGESRRFQRLREKVWKRTVPMWDHIVEYTHPRIEYRNTKRPLLSDEARATPEWMALKELYVDGTDVGTLSYGLEKTALKRAINSFPFASNPYHAKATGGYKILSPLYSLRGPSMEWEMYTQDLIEARRYGAAHVLRRDMVDTVKLSETWHPSLFDHQVDKPIKRRRIGVNPYVEREITFEADEITSVPRVLSQDMFLRIIDSAFDSQNQEHNIDADVATWMFDEHTEEEYEPPPDDDFTALLGEFEDIENQAEHGLISPGESDSETPERQWIL